MKKIFKLITLLSLVFILTGCVKENINMEIGKDKRVNLTIISATKNSMSSEINPSKIADNLENKGFIKEPYKEDSWNGYKLTKEYESIDDISTTDTITVELSDLLDENNEDISYYFQKKESFFKTTYIANFTIDINANEDGSANEEINGYKDTVDLKYTVTLPNPSTKQNTTNISQDGRTLTWILEYGKVNKINYQFSMTNNRTYILISIIFIILVAFLTYFILKSNNKTTKIDKLLKKIIPKKTKKNKNK